MSDFVLWNRVQDEDGFHKVGRDAGYSEHDLARGVTLEYRPSASGETEGTWILTGIGGEVFGKRKGSAPKIP